MNIDISQLVTQILPGISSAFTQFCGTPPVQQPTLKTESVDGIIGTISFMGDVRWTLVLGLPQATAESMAKRFSGFDIPYESNDMVDVVGELANVLAGHVSPGLETLSIKTQMSVPSVVRGKGMALFSPQGTANRRLFLTSSQGEFWIDILCSKNEALVK